METENGRHVDPARIEVICEDDDVLAVDLIDTLLAEAEPMFRALNEHAQVYEVSRLNGLACALKDLAGEVGAFELRDAATRLAHASGPKMTPASCTLEAEIHAIAVALEHIRIVQRRWKAQSLPGV